MKADFLSIGHRGAKGYAPENTLLAIEKAIDLGVDCVEIDVRFVDQELLVFHDHRLERTTNGAGYLAEHGLDYLHELDAGWGQHIPTLREVLDVVDKRISVNIEMKGSDTAPLVAATIKEYVTRLDWGYAQFIVSSFDHKQLQQIKALDPNNQLGALYCGVPLQLAADARALGAYSVHMSLDFIDPAFIVDAQRHGMKVFVYTVNHPEDIEQMMSLNVDGVFSDFPDRVQDVRDLHNAAKATIANW